MATLPNSRRLALALAAAAPLAIAIAAPASAQSISEPRETMQLNTGLGRMVTTSTPITDVFVADGAVADVQVRSPNQFWVFGKKRGETTVYAVSKSGKVVYSTQLRIGDNYNSLDQMLATAMPEAAIRTTAMNGVVLLTGTVAQPADGAEAERLVQAFVGKDTTVVSRLRTATPLQVNLQVKIAEVSRSFLKNIGTNITNRDSGSFLFGISRGSQGSISTVPGVVGDPTAGVDANGARPGDTIFKFPAAKEASTLIGAAGRFLGTDILASLDLGETIGQVTTLANPNLTALSGETANFLAGGEIPIPISQGLGAVSVQFKQYGVSLAYTPTVLSDGRISLRVRPEVSQLSAAGAVTFQGISIPALTTRRAETTVELGSGQSFMIAGLLQNNHDNQIDKAPGLGDLPILGTLFRSNGFRRQETELVIVVTPYLVRPVDANAIALPTDGYKTPTDVERVLLGQLESPGGNGGRPKPTMAPVPAPAPTIGVTTPAPVGAAPAPSPVKRDKADKGKAAPGFSN